jgi:hypothetical protein
MQLLCALDIRGYITHLKNINNHEEMKRGIKCLT